MNRDWKEKLLWEHIHKVGYVCGILTTFDEADLKHIRGAHLLLVQRTVGRRRLHQLRVASRDQ